jgi:hypothetical protein
MIPLTVGLLITLPVVLVSLFAARYFNAKRKREKLEQKRLKIQLEQQQLELDASRGGLEASRGGGDDSGKNLFGSGRHLMGSGQIELEVSGRLESSARLEGSGRNVTPPPDEEWEEHMANGTKVFFSNTRTHQVQWGIPLCPGWRKFFSPQKNRYYYGNCHTNEVRWEPPVPEVPRGTISIVPAPPGSQAAAPTDGDPAHQFGGPVDLASGEWYVS